MMLIRKNLFIWILSLVTISFFVFLKIFQYNSFSGIGWEYSTWFDMTLYNTINGKFLLTGNTSPNGGIPFFAEHFSPILIILIPVYYLFQSHYTLVVLHGLICASAIIPLYFLVKEYFPKYTFAIITFPLMYFFSRVISYGLMYEVHIEVFYPLLFFSLFLFYKKQNWIWFYIILVLTLCVKEDASVAVFGFGLFMFFNSSKTNRKNAFIVMGLSVVWLIASVGFIIPHFRAQTGGGDYKFIQYWSEFGKTKGEILMNMLNPLKDLQVLFSGKKISWMFNAFSVFLFLPFCTLSGFIFLVVPGWFVLFSSNNEHMNGMINYYGLMLTPFLFYSSIIGLKNIANRFNLQKKGIAVFCTLLLLVNAGNSRVFNIISDGFKFENKYSVFGEFVSLIPPNASVSVQENLIAHLPYSNDKYVLNKEKAKTDYTIIDKTGNTWPLDESEYKTAVENLYKDNVVILEKNDMVLFKTK